MILSWCWANVYVYVSMRENDLSLEESFGGKLSKFECVI